MPFQVVACKTSRGARNAILSNPGAIGARSSRLAVPGVNVDALTDGRAARDEAPLGCTARSDGALRDNGEAAVTWRQLRDAGYHAQRYTPLLVRERSAVQELGLEAIALLLRQLTAPRGASPGSAGAVHRARPARMCASGSRSRGRWRNRAARAVADPRRRDPEDQGPARRQAMPLLCARIAQVAPRGRGIEGKPTIVVCRVLDGCSAKCRAAPLDSAARPTTMPLGGVCYGRNMAAPLLSYNVRERGW